jgi:hypothetical protein
MLATTAGLTLAHVSTAASSQTVIYSFSTTDGANPNAIAHGKHGNFYGTAAAGGTNHLGTVLEDCAPGEIRTPDPQVRSLMLYPTELRAHSIK